jgi:TRAP-type C4-dicarboxylate transport system permease small subunit
MTYNKKKISEEKQKMIIILLTFLFIFYLIIICIYAYIINNRTILKTDIVTKIDHSVWGGGSGTRYDYSYLKDKDYYLIRGYVVIPSLQVLIERNIIKEGYVITYYVEYK